MVRCITSIAMVIVLSACGSSRMDDWPLRRAPLLEPDTGVDTSNPDASDTGEDFATDSGVDTGPVTDLTGSAWAGSGIQLTLSSGATEGMWSDGCLGGYITGPFAVTAGAFDWPARFHGGAGAPEPRDMRAVGTVTRGMLTLSIVELSGETFWGPWTLTPTDNVEIGWCE